MNPFKFFATQKESFEYALSEKHEFFFAVDKANDGRKKYGSYKNVNDFLAIYKALPDDKKHFYEILTENAPRFEYYDIDEKESVIEPEKILAKFFSIRLKFLKFQFGLCPPQDEWRIMDSSKRNENETWKISFHLINRSVVWKNQKETEFWYKLFYDYNQTHCGVANLFDTAVDTKNRCMRIIGSSKFGQVRPLLPLYSCTKYDMIEFFITNTNGKQSEINLSGEIEKFQENELQYKAENKKIIDYGKNFRETILLNEDYDEVEKLVDLIRVSILASKHSLCDEGKPQLTYANFRNLCFAYANASEDSFEAKMNFLETEVYPLYRNNKDYNCGTILSTILKSERDGKCYTKASLHFWAKENEEYKNVFKPKRFFSIEGGHVGVAKLFYEKMKDKYLFTNETWFELTEVGRWQELSAKNNGLINAFYECVSPLINEMFEDIHQEIEENGKKDELEDKLKHIENLRKRLNEVKFQTDSVKFASAYFKKKVEFDSNPYLLGFNNGVWDFKLKTFRKYEFSDYMTLTVGYDYDEKKANDETYKKELNDLLCKALPNPEIRQFYLETMARCLIGINSQKFIIANGTGGNAKGVCIENLGSAVFGDYAYNFPVQNLTDTKKTGANTEIASCHLKRFIYAKEPSNKKKLDNATIKELTGGGEINARKIFSLQLKTLLTGTLFMETNPKLNWNEEPNEAELRRVNLIPFTSRFTHNPEEVDEANHIYLANDELKNKEWFLSRANAFFEILKNTLLANNCKLNVVAPSIIKQKTEAYLQRGINLLEFIKNEYEEAHGEAFSLIEFIRDFKMSEFYNFLPRDEKANIRQTIEDLFQTNTFCKKYYRDRYRQNGKDIRKAIIGLRRKMGECGGSEFETGLPPL